MQELQSRRCNAISIRHSPIVNRCFTGVLLYISTPSNGVIIVFSNNTNKSAQTHEHSWNYATITTHTSSIGSTTNTTASKASKFRSMNLLTVPEKEHSTVSFQVLRFQVQEAYGQVVKYLLGWARGKVETFSTNLVA